MDFPASSVGAFDEFFLSTVVIAENIAYETRRGCLDLSLHVRESRGKLGWLRLLAKKYTVCTWFDMLNGPVFLPNRGSVERIYL